MSVKPQLMTADEFFDKCAGIQAELVNGEVCQMTPSGFEHGTIAAELTALLVTHVRQHNLGKVLTSEVGFVIKESPDTVRAPDVAFVSKPRIPADRAGFARLAPDLVAEIISPHDRMGDIDQKVQEYLRAGVRIVWVIYPKTRTAVEYQPPNVIRKLKQDDALDGGKVIPGFSAPISELFS